LGRTVAEFGTEGDETRLLSSWGHQRQSGDETMFTQYERLNLLNQFRILDMLDPDNGWSSFVSILKNGYEGEYRQITDVLHPPMPAPECALVINILAVFDILQRPWWNNFDQVPEDAKFSGFDGNDEGEYLSYFRFLREEEPKFVDLVLSNPNDLDSHFPTLAGYRRMVAKWIELGEPVELSQNQRNEILQARVHPE
jgi:uncharacterized protein YfbU (UPF0304 family)